MRCFVHHDNEAIAICRGCSKGLCAACAVDAGRGLACSPECAERACATDALVDQNLRLMKPVDAIFAQRSTIYKVCKVMAMTGGAVTIVMAAVFAWEVQHTPLATNGGVMVLAIGIAALGVILLAVGILIKNPIPRQPATPYQKGQGTTTQT
jgi:hypothetical protein